MFWMNDPSLLFDHTQSWNNPIERLNIIMSIAIAISIILTLLFNHSRMLLISIIVAIITVILYKKQTENWLNVSNQCQQSTKDNPLMNPNILIDVTNGTADIPACYGDLDIDDNFDKTVFKDVHDMYDRGLSRRQFYTVPGSTIPNDQEGLGVWLYNSNNNQKSCKEGNMSRCAQNINMER